MWLNAPGGLVRADGTLKPSYERLRGLVKDEWWVPPTVMRTDDAGRVTVSGFLGDYRISAGGAGEATFALDTADEATIDARLGAVRG